MRKNLLLVLALFTAICIQSNAAVTLEQTTDPEYMVNNGYSELTAEEVQIQKTRLAGQSVEPLYEQKHNKFTRFLKKCYSYIDPAWDSDERYHHDINPSPMYSDL